MKEFTYVITDPEGLHARPAGLLVKKAAAYSSVIKIKNGEKAGNAKAILGIMGLCVKNGQAVTVTAEGEDEAVAITELQAFFKENL